MALLKIKKDIPIIEGISTESHPALQSAADLQDVQDFDWAGDGSAVKRPGFAVYQTDTRGNAITNPTCVGGSNGRTFLVGSGPVAPTGSDVATTAQYVYENQRASASGAGKAWVRKEISGLAMLEEDQVYSSTNHDILNTDSATIGRFQCIAVDRPKWSSTYITTNVPQSGAIPAPAAGAGKMEVLIIDTDTGATVAAYSIDTGTTTNLAWCPRVIATENKFLIFHVNFNELRCIIWDASSPSNGFSSIALEGAPNHFPVFSTVAGPEVYDVHVDPYSGAIFIAQLPVAATGFRLMRYANVAALSTGASHTVTLATLSNVCWISLGSTLNNVVVACHNETTLYVAQYAKSNLSVAVANRAVTFTPVEEVRSVAVDTSSTTDVCIAATITVGGAVSTPETYFILDSESGPALTAPVTSFVAGALGSSFSGCFSTVNSSFPQISYVVIQKPYRAVTTSVVTGSGTFTYPVDMDFQPRYLVLQVGYSPNDPTYKFTLTPIGVVKNGEAKRFYQANGVTAGGMFGSTLLQRGRLPGWSWRVSGTPGSTAGLEKDLQPAAVYARSAVCALPGNPSLALKQSDISTISVSPVHAALLRTAAAGDSLLINGGGATASADSLPESGFFSIPALSSGAGSVAPAAAPAAGIYRTIAVFAWRDEKGNLYRSAPSLDASYNYSGAGNIDRYAVYPDLVTRRGVDLLKNKTVKPVRPIVEVYQTDVGGAVFYLSGQYEWNEAADIPAIPPWKGWGATYEPQGEQLYTTGNVLENGVVPNALDVEVHNQRAFALASGNRIRFSKLFRPNTGIEWPEEFEIQLSSRGGRAYAIRSLGDRLIIFKRGQIEYLSGVGPQSDGSGQQYSEPDVLVEGIGCVNPRAIVSTPDGLMFDGTKGFYFITPSLAIQPVGAKLRAVSEGINLFPGTYTSGTHLPEKQEVHFSSMFKERGIVRWNYRKQRWSRLTANKFIASHMALIGSDVCFIVPPVDIPGSLLMTSSGVWRERASASPIVYSDQNQAGTEVQYFPKIVTGWIKFEGILACERVYNILIRTKKTASGANWPYFNPGTPETSQIKVVYNYKSGTGLTGGDLVSDTQTFKITSTETPSTTADLFRFHVPKQKVEALELEISFPHSIVSTLETYGIGTIVGMSATLGIRPGLGPKPGITAATNVVRTN